MRFHEMDSLMPDQLDFVPRERRGQITKLLIAFIVTILVVLVAAYSSLFSSAEPYVPMLTIFLVAVLGVYVMLRHQMTLDLLMSAEYQNMLLAQGFGVGSGFGLIVKRDGTIVHASEGMDAVFPTFDYAPSQVLDGVFRKGAVRQTDRERIMAAIYSCSNERIVFPITIPDQEPREYILTVEPMPRPSGFSVIRGREYLGKRAGLQQLPDALSLTSADKLEHMLSTSSSPHFTTDAYGRIEYANPAFDLMLGYTPGEIIVSKLSLHHLVFSMGKTVVTEEYTLHDYVGAVELIHKDGHRFKGLLQQSLARDGKGKSMGATGTIAKAVA
jgi:PAS domain S-box-containing protein